MKELKNILSNLIWVFLQPILETNSMVCWGVKASMACYSVEKYRVAKKGLAVLDGDENAEGSIARG